MKGFRSGESHDNPKSDTGIRRDTDEGPFHQGAIVIREKQPIGNADGPVWFGLVNFATLATWSCPPRRVHAEAARWRRAERTGMAESRRAREP